MDKPMQVHETGTGNAGGFLAGLVVGGLAGAGTMLLLAPESGKRTRSDIQHKGIALRDQTVETVENTMAEARIRARQITAPARRQAKELQQRGQDILDEHRDRPSHGPDQPSHAVEQVLQEGD
jgi:gas vesicle protein